MSDKIINWNLDSLPLQDLSECLHDQLIVKGIWGQEKARNVNSVGFHIA